MGGPGAPLEDLVTNVMLVDQALERRAASGCPIRFGLFGIGAIGRAIVSQSRRMPGIECAAICNRTIANVLDALEQLGIEDIEVVEDERDLDRVISAGRVAVTDDPSVVCRSEVLECLLEATGHVEYGARVASRAIDNGKHIVLMNAELDATVGPILKRRADEAGVLISGCDGDQPAVELNLYRFVRSIGLEPRVCGSMKGLLDHYRTPSTQASFAAEWGQKPQMVTSFADGTKVAMEQAVVANATGMQVAQRGMLGMEHHGHIDDMVHRYDLDAVRPLGGIVDYVLGASPGPGVYVFADAQDEDQIDFLRYAKLGDGPLYSFYVPYHLMAMEAPLTVARVVEFGDVAVAPAGAPIVDVAAVAKKDLPAGHTIDGLGGYSTYGLCENHATVRSEDLAPIGLVEGAVLRRAVDKDQVLTMSDIDLKPGQIVHELRRQQDEAFPSKDQEGG